ncbi:MAG: 3-deoxy-manno-octulosonate cytidylyltransferase [Bacillota bacterium]
MKITAIIPARYESSRFPGKPLVEINNQPMIEHVYKRVKKAEVIDEVIVATDDRRITEAVKNFGGKVEMTSSAHKSGTDRIAEVAENLKADIIVNVQGDEPLIKPVMIDQIVKPFKRNNDLIMTTLKKRIDDLNKINNPNVVKVVTDATNFALYFSRATIPYQREDNSGHVDYYKHIGVYAFRRDFLLEYSKMEESKLEKIESLEQLRVLENGYDIKVIETAYDTVGVDTPEDLNYVKELIQREDIDYRLE